MPSRLKRYHTEGHDHFITFSCYRRLPYLNHDPARIVFEETLEKLRAGGPGTPSHTAKPKAGAPFMTALPS